ncbi:MAG: creatinine amidohydrolase [Thermomicrobiales bacterium]|nr:creatinine amidohydrolase [Thermomicrobiales bacterium]
MIDERRMELAKMTSPETAEALANAEVALIPVGATEQHGPNMTLETDTVVAYRLALRMATALYPRAVVAPPLPYGVSYHHMKFPGTMTLSPETFQDVVLEVVESLRRHGLERFFVVDGHAGNQGALDVLMTKLWGHACEIEASMGLALQPDIVRSEALEAGKLRQLSLPYSNVLETPRVSVPLSFEEITENGALGDARQASEAFGQELTEAVIRRSVEFLERYLSE